MVAFKGLIFVDRKNLQKASSIFKGVSKTLDKYSKQHFADTLIKNYHIYIYFN